MRTLTPSTIRAPFGRYSHGIEVAPGARLVVTSGQLGAYADDTVPDSVAAQAAVCFANISAILAEAGMTPGDVIRINSYLTSRADFAPYMAVRDAWLKDFGAVPASTLLIVSGFTRPEFLVEVEVTAAAV